MNLSPKQLESFSAFLRLKYGLVALSAALVAIYLTLVWHSGDSAHLGMSVLFGLAAGTLLWEKRQSLRFGTNFGSIMIGVLLFGAIAWGLAVTDLGNAPQNRDVVSIEQQHRDLVLRLMPLFSALGVCLFASGFKLKQYRQELTILFFLGVPSAIAYFLPDISPITAKFSALLLWYSGFDVTISGVYVSLPTGGVEVYSGCSGIESVTYLLGISIVCLFSLPVKGKKRYFIPVIAVFIGYFVNLIRVALMVILAAAQNKAAFTFWHTGEGSLVFGMTSIFLFGLFYFFVMRQEAANRQSL
jgi:cyanoexosortase A